MPKYDYEGTAIVCWLLIVECHADSEHFVQEQTLALVHNLVDGYVDSANYVIGEDGMVMDAIARQLNNASAPGVCIQVSFLQKYSLFIYLFWRFVII